MLCLDVGLEPPHHLPCQERPRLCYTRPSLWERRRMLM